MNGKIIKAPPEAIQQEQQLSPLAAMQMALSQGLDPEKMGQLLEVQAAWEAREARKSYARAMAEFKRNPPKIDKDQTVSYGNTKYKHASLANVTNKINAALSQHGLTVSWRTSQDSGVTVECIISHIDGHFESTSMMAPADNSGKKNPIQSIGSTITYLQRYTLLALTGLATFEQDDDSRSYGVEFITEEQEANIENWIHETGADKKKFLAWLKAESLDQIPKADYARAIEALRQKGRT